MTRHSKTLTITLVGICLLLGIIGAAAQNKFAPRHISAVGAVADSNNLGGNGFLFVTKTDDTNDGVCDTDCSLREAAAAANAASIDSQIFFTFDPGDANCANGVCTITLALGEIAITNTASTTITGTGAGSLTISGGGVSRIFYITGRAMIQNLTLTGGNGVGDSSSGSGSAIYAFYPSTANTLVLDNVNVTANTSTAGFAAVVFDNGVNHEITNSTFSGNSSDACGGFVAGTTTLTVRNTTVSGNSVTGAGGGFCSWNSSVVLRSDTIAGNAAGGVAGGMYVDTSIDIGNTIVAGNTSGDGEADIHGGTMVSQGNNLIGDNTTVETDFPSGSPNANNDYVGIISTPLNAQLAPLGYYGGPTPTRALFINSPAVDHGNAALAGTDGTDQRLSFRVGQTDIGAFEYNVYFGLSSLPNGYGFVPYSQQLTADRGECVPDLTRKGATISCLNGNFAPGVYALVPIAGESLPLGLALNSNGLIAGTPTSLGTYNFTVMATDPFDGMSGVQRYTIQTFGPTAANVSVSGKIFSSEGRSLANARVVLTDSSGNSRTAVSNTFGNYRFTGVQSGQTYIFTVHMKGYRFAPQVATVGDDLAEFNFSSL
jgi:CSLREA domain-containing protein